MAKKHPNRTKNLRSVSPETYPIYVRILNVVYTLISVVTKASDSRSRFLVFVMYFRNHVRDFHCTGFRQRKVNWTPRRCCCCVVLLLLYRIFRRAHKGDSKRTVFLLFWFQFFARVLTMDAKNNGRRIDEDSFRKCIELIIFFIYIWKFHLWYVSSVIFATLNPKFSAFFVLFRVGNWAKFGADNADLERVLYTFGKFNTSVC